MFGVEFAVESYEFIQMVTRWCDDNILNPYDIVWVPVTNTFTHTGQGSYYRFVTISEEDFLLFKLTWG